MRGGELVVRGGISKKTFEQMHKGSRDFRGRTVLAEGTANANA